MINKEPNIGDSIELLRDLSFGKTGEVFVIYDYPSMGSWDRYAPVFEVVKPLTNYVIGKAAMDDFKVL